MARKMALTFCLLASCVWCLTLVTPVDSAPPTPTPARATFKPAASLHSLMAGQGQHFRDIGQLLGDQTARDRAARLVVGAELLAELANVNTLHQNEGDYVRWAGEVRDIALQLSLEAGKKKEAREERMGTLYKKLKSTCIACHDQYQE